MLSITMSRNINNFFDIIDKRQDVELHQALQIAAYYLNPYLYYTNHEIKTDKEVTLELHKGIQNIITYVMAQGKMGEQLETYQRADGFFGLPMPITQRSIKFHVILIHKLNLPQFSHYAICLDFKIHLQLHGGAGLCW